MNIGDIMTVVTPDNDRKIGIVRTDSKVSVMHTNILTGELNIDVVNQSDLDSSQVNIVGNMDQTHEILYSYFIHFIDEL
jgi:hypothetical protein